MWQQQEELGLTFLFQSGFRQDNDNALMAAATDNSSSSDPMEAAAAAAAAAADTSSPIPSRLRKQPSKGAVAAAAAATLKVHMPAGGTTTVKFGDATDIKARCIFLSLFLRGLEVLSLALSSMLGG
jgi:hypothetical protein